MSLIKTEAKELSDDLHFESKGFMEAVSRQPEVLGKIMPYFFVGAALSEACAIYAFVIALKLSGLMG